MTYYTESKEKVYKGYYINENGDIYNAETGEEQEKESIDIDIIDTLENGGGEPQTVKKTFTIINCKDDIKDLDGEQWKVIPNTNNSYLISNQGRVKSLKGKKAIILKPTYTKGGYARVDISYNKVGRVTVLVHKLVAENFLVKPNEPYIEIHHINDKTDNRAISLMYLNRKEHRELHKRLNAEKGEQQTNE